MEGEEPTNDDDLLLSDNNNNDNDDSNKAVVSADENCYVNDYNVEGEDVSIRENDCCIVNTSSSSYNFSSSLLGGCAFFKDSISGFVAEQNAAMKTEGAIIARRLRNNKYSNSAEYGTDDYDESSINADTGICHHHSIDDDDKNKNYNNNNNNNNSNIDNNIDVVDLKRNTTLLLQQHHSLRRKNHHDDEDALDDVKMKQDLMFCTDIIDKMKNDTNNDNEFKNYHSKYNYRDLLIHNGDDNDNDNYIINEKEQDEEDVEEDEGDSVVMESHSITTHLIAQTQTSIVEMICHQTKCMSDIVDLIKAGEDASCFIIDDDEDDSGSNSSSKDDDDDGDNNNNNNIKRESHLLSRSAIIRRLITSIVLVFTFGITFRQWYNLDLILNMDITQQKSGRMYYYYNNDNNNEEDDVIGLNNNSLSSSSFLEDVVVTIIKTNIHHHNHEQHSNSILDTFYNGEEVCFVSD